MDMVRLSIAGGVALAGLLTIASVAHHGHADPLPKPSLTGRDRSVAAAPVLVERSTATSFVVRLDQTRPFGALSPFPVASPPLSPTTFDRRFMGGVGAWETYIDEASRRFSVPPSWVRSVMRAESAGLQFLDGRPITSSKGAMGLMQVMPGTYANMRSRYGLGPSPYDPRDNVLAGTAYIREMYDRFGSPGFLAAYNAGPGRVGDFLGSGRALPEETRRYLAAVTPSVIVGADRAPVETQASMPSPVQDLTTSRWPVSAESTPLSAPHVPEEAPLFVTAARTGSIPSLQAGAPSNDGLFVALGVSDRRRKSPMSDAPEN